MKKLLIYEINNVTPIVALTFKSNSEIETYLKVILKEKTYGDLQFENKTEIIPAKKELREVEVQPEIKELQTVVVKEAVLDAQGNVIEPAVTEQREIIIQERIVEMQEVVIEPEQTIIHPATHTYEIVDITAEINAQKALELRQKLRAAGERLIDEMSVKNTELGLTLAQLRSIMIDEDAVFVRELLWAGSLESAKAVIEEKREKFEGMMGGEYVGWILSRIEESL